MVHELWRIVDFSTVFLRRGRGNEIHLMEVDSGIWVEARAVGTLSIRSPREYEEESEETYL